MLVSGKSANKKLKNYRRMGVVCFKKAVLNMERILHYRSGKKNGNYHVKGSSIKSINKFKYYLFYNAFIHFMSLLFTVLYFALSICRGVRVPALDAVIYIITVINIYCILLQHYNYLRIKEVQNRFWQKQRKYSIENKDKIREHLSKIRQEELLEDRYLLIKLYDCIRWDKQIYLDETSRAGFERMNECLKIAGCREGKHTTKAHEVDVKGLRLDEKIGRFAKAARPYGKLEIRIQWLIKHVLRKKDLKLLTCPQIVIKDALTEEQYSRVFHYDTPDKAVSTISILMEIYNSGEIV